MRCGRSVARRLEADVCGQPLLAGTVASERQLIGIVDTPDRFRAASLSDRLSSLDPLLPFGGSSARSATQRIRSFAAATEFTVSTPLRSPRYQSHLDIDDRS